jgi:outer membrane protein assembly factor BamB
MFRGNPEHTGVYPDTGVGTTGQLAWKFDTGDSLHSSPAVSGGLVYVGSNYRYSFERKGPGYLYAFDAASGAERWKFKTGDSVYSSPAVSGGLV